MKVRMKCFSAARRLLTVGLFLALAGCHPAPLVVPSYIQTVGVELAQNMTSYFGLDTLMTQNIIQQFQIDGRLPIGDPEKSDMTVRVIIRKYNEDPMFYDLKTNNVLQYRISIVYDLASLDKREKKTFLEDKETTHSVFYYTPDYAGAITETKDQALARLAQDTATAIVRRVLTGY